MSLSRMEEKPEKNPISLCSGLTETTDLILFLTRLNQFPGDHHWHWNFYTHLPLCAGLMTGKSW